MLVAVLAAALGAAAPAQERAASEVEVKAVYVFQFTKFVEWPAEAFPDPTTPVTIGVLGADPVGEALERAVAGETVSGRPFVIRRFAGPQEVGPCHVLYIPASERGRIPRLLERLGRGVLTVGDGAGFAGQGGMIGFVREGGKVRFEIDQAAAEAAGLKVSARLLGLARRREGR